MVLFEKLKPSHMSGDEPEFETDNERQTHDRVFFIVEAEWQSPELITFLRTLDAWHVYDWRQAIGDRLPGGNPPRKRVSRAVPRVVNSVAPKGLWKNCYSQAWLDKLKPHKRAELKMINSDYDFSLPGWSEVPEGVADRLRKEATARKAKKRAAKKDQSHIKRNADVLKGKAKEAQSDPASATSSSSSTSSASTSFASVLG